MSRLPRARPGSLFQGFTLIVPAAASTSCSIAQLEQLVTDHTFEGGATYDRRRP